MIASATRLLNEFEKLAPEEQLIVRKRVVALTQDRQRQALNRLRGASRGKGLLANLLSERAKERLRA